MVVLEPQISTNKKITAYDNDELSHHSILGYHGNDRVYSLDEAPLALGRGETSEHDQSHHKSA